MPSKRTNEIKIRLNDDELEHINSLAKEIVLKPTKLKDE